MAKIKTWKEAVKPFRKAADMSKLSKEDLKQITEEARSSKKV